MAYSLTVETDRPYIHRGSDDANTKYILGVTAPDPFHTIVTQDSVTAIVRSTELRRFRRESDADRVVPYSRFTEKDIRGEVASEGSVLRAVLDSEDIKEIAVGPIFPSYLTDELRSHGVDVDVLKENPVEEWRIQKTSSEIENLEDAQENTESAMRRVREVLEESVVNDDDELLYQGDKLTSEIVKNEIRRTVSEDFAFPEGIIVSHGEQASEPHNFGSGVLESGESIVVDIFPKGPHGYFGDMTRTFVKKPVDSQIEDMHVAVDEAMTEAFSVLSGGVSGNEVHEAVCSIIEQHGYSSDPDSRDGFIHATGHGVGLELHELPNLSNEDNNVPVDSVVTVEPGIYIEGVGGVRCEDMVRVTEDGFENLNQMEKSLQKID